MLELTQGDPTPEEILHRLQTLQKDQNLPASNERRLSRGRIDREELVVSPLSPPATEEPAQR